MEKIIRIEETVFKENPQQWFNYEGFQIITDKQIIKLGISDDQSCCEQTGYFMSEDNLKEFEGSNLLNIFLVDTNLNVERYNRENLYSPYLMFVNIKTDKGLLQFVAYNDHNGYYGHSAIVISEQLNHKEVL
jgi:hypothetical protein